MVRYLNNYLNNYYNTQRCFVCIIFFFIKEKEARDFSLDNYFKHLLEACSEEQLSTIRTSHHPLSDQTRSKVLVIKNKSCQFLGTFLLKREILNIEGLLFLWCYFGSCPCFPTHDECYMSDLTFVGLLSYFMQTSSYNWWHFNDKYELTIVHAELKGQ